MSKRKREEVELETSNRNVDKELLFSTLVNDVYLKCEQTTKRLALVAIVRDFFIQVLTNYPQPQLKTNVLLSSLQLLSVSKGRTRARNLTISSSSSSSKKKNIADDDVEDDLKKPASSSLLKTTEFGIGDVILYAIVAESAKTTVDKIRDTTNVTGDLATTASQLIQVKTTTSSKTPTTPLTVKTICDAFQDIVNVSGTASVAKRKSIVASLISQCRTKDEIKYIIRLVQNNLRINLQESSVLVALAHAFVMTSKSLKSSSSSSSTASSKEKKIPATELKQAADTLKLIYSQKPSFQVIVPLLVKHGINIDDLPQECFIEVGTPIRPMLGKPLKSVQDMLKKLATGHRKTLKTLKSTKEDDDEMQDDKDAETTVCKFVLEFKYDGKRAQIHCCRHVDDGSFIITLYSRSLKIMNDEFPDVIELLQKTLSSDVESCILDCEIICIDTSPQGKILSFQQLTNRSRNSDIQDLRNANSRVGVVIFDVLYMTKIGDDTDTDDDIVGSLMNVEYHQRQATIAHLFPKITLSESKLSEKAGLAAKYNLASYNGNCVRQATNQIFEYTMPILAPKTRGQKVKSVTDTEQLEFQVDTFLKLSLASACEGVMVKPWTLRYKPNDRSWFKLKKDYIAGLADSLDLVPVGGYYGRGKRTGGYGSFLLACRNPTSGALEPLCKTGTGFSEQLLDQLSKSLVVATDTNTKITNNTKNTKESKNSKTSKTTKTTKTNCKYHASDSECDQDCPVSGVNTKTLSDSNVNQDDDALQKCDVFFKPTQVWEIICADLTLSDLYRAAYGYKLFDPVSEKLKSTKAGKSTANFTFSKGVSTRFPRFIRVRDDKTIAQATCSKQVADLYNQQFASTIDKTQPIGGAKLLEKNDAVVDSDLDGSASD
jgi:DNA ligase-1